MPDEPYCELQTTHFQRLAGEGSSFRDCISGYPLCSPYRAMLMSGRWPFQTGVVENAVQFPDDEISLGVTFRNAGYRTGYIGKWHLSPGDERGEFIPKGPARHGFEDWQVWSNTVHHFDAFTFDPDSGEKIERQGYSASLMTDAAVNFIGAFDAEPWMLVVSWGPPHPPFRAAPAETKQLYDPELLELRPNLPAKVPPILRQRLQGYYAHISALDKELGRLLHKLDETRQAERTIVVYTSDHGTMMGSQGLSGKRLPYDESCKVPFLIRYPGVIAPGWRSKLLLSSIDLFPSLCALRRQRSLGRNPRGERHGSRKRVPDACAANQEGRFGTQLFGAFVPRSQDRALHLCSCRRWALVPLRQSRGSIPDAQLDRRPGTATNYGRAR